MAFLLLAIFSSILVFMVNGSLDDMVLPELVECGKIHGTGAERTDDNVIGYTYMIDRKGTNLTTTWARAVPNPHGNLYTYQFLTGEEPNITITHTTSEYDAIFTDLYFNVSQYNDPVRTPFVLRLAVDDSLGRLVDLYVFPHYHDIYQTPAPKIQLPSSATYYVPETQANGTNDKPVWTQITLEASKEPVDIEHEARVTIPKHDSTPELTIEPSFVRVYEEERPTGYIASDDDYWVSVPKEPVQDQARYLQTEDSSDSGDVVIKQKFSVRNAFKNDSGLYQFDVKVSSAKGPLYHISAPFLLRRNDYVMFYHGVLPCSPYRRDTRDKYLRSLGFLEGDLPCVRLVSIGEKYRTSMIRMRFTKDEYGDNKPLALNNDRFGLSDVKDRFYVVNDPERYAPWDKENDDDVAVIVNEGPSGRRQESFRFRPYRRMELIDKPADVEDTTVTFNCAATWAKTLKIVRIDKSFYDTFGSGRAYVNSYDLEQYYRSLRPNWYKGIEDVKSTGSEKNGDRLYVMTAKFNKQRMRRLFTDEKVVACYAYNEFDLVYKLLTDDYQME